MRKLNLLISLLLLSIAGAAQQSSIVEVDWLAEHLKDHDLLIFHVGTEDDYNEGHIAGARFILSDVYTLNEGDRIYDLPELPVLEALLESKGVSEGSRIVVYPGRSSHLPVTRLLFTLNYLGFDQVAILSGGKAAWVANGQPLSTETPEFTPTSLTLKPNKKLVVTKEQVADALSKNVKIVDCRAEAYYTGIDVNEHHSGGRKGHIPGAKSIPYLSLFEKTDGGYYRFISKEELAGIFEKQGLKKDDDIILYCHIGLQLTSVYTTSKLLGYKNVRVFDGSFHEWGPDTSLPVTTD